MDVEEEWIKDLGDGLVLRHGRATDGERLGEFNAIIHKDEGTSDPDYLVGAWTRDLMSGRHPDFRPEDATVVEHQPTGKIISSICLISQTWSYEGLTFPMGYPELVGTDPEYRGRGLIREQFTVLHQWSEKRGHKLQAIAGIPYYYRLFGYEMALDLGGGQAGFEPQIPVLPKGQKEPYLIRPAVEADLTEIGRWYDQGTKRSLVNCVRRIDHWRHDVFEKSNDNVDRRIIRVIENRTGERVGFISHPVNLWGSVFACNLFELEQGVSYVDVTPSVMRYLWATGKKLARQNKKRLTSIEFNLGAEHPVYQAAAGCLPVKRNPYAFYIRVPNLPDFIQSIAPVIEKRIQTSPVVTGYSGEIKLGFYRDGLRLILERGKLVTVSSWKGTHSDNPDVLFPDLTFLQLLFGYRSLDELDYGFADCGIQKEAARPILQAMFPKQHSHILPTS